MGISSQDKDDLERELLFGLLNSTHESMKWMWQIVMGGALVIATQTVYPDMKNILSIFNKFSEFSEENLQTLLLFFFVYLPFFFRVFYGNNRYIDLNYVEIMALKKTKISDMVHLNQFTGISRFLDIFALIFHGIFFIFLGSVLGDVKLFIYSSMAFLAFNFIYLFFVVLRNGVEIRIPKMKNFTKRMYDTRNKYINEKPRNDALLLWVFNNLFHFIFLIIFVCILDKYTFSDNIFIYGSIFILLMNSLIDIVTTWEFYFPDMEELENAISTLK